MTSMMTSASQYHSMDYRSVSQGRSSVPPAVGGPWYPDVAPAPRVPRGRSGDPTRSLLLDIPSTSPAGGPQSQYGGGDRPQSASTQHLLAVATPPPQQPAPTDISTVNPELRQAQKTGNLYNISLNLNALQSAAAASRPPSTAAAGNTESMRRVRSMQDLAASWGQWPPPPSTTADNNEQGPETTVVQVYQDNDNRSPPVATPTLPQTTQRQSRPATRTPSVHTLRIPPSPSGGRRSRSASRTGDEGFVIKSLKSTDENPPPSGRVSSTRPVSVIGDGEVGFDVELTRQLQQQQQQQQWEMERSSSQQLFSVSSTSGHRSLLIESVTPSNVTGGPRQQPLDTVDSAPEPTYTMTMNQRMTMNYEPPSPQPQPQPFVPEYRDDAVQQRTSYTAHRTTRSETATADGDWEGEPQRPPAVVRKKKKKKPQLVNSGTQMSVEKPTRKPKEKSDDELIQRKKVPITKSPRKTPESSTMSRATQMAVNKSTQITQPQDSDSDDDDPMRPSRKPVTRSPRKTPDPSMVNQATQMAVNKSTQIMKPQNSDSDDDDLMRRTRKPIPKSPPRTPEPSMVSRATQMAFNKSTQITNPQDYYQDEYYDDKGFDDGLIRPSRKSKKPEHDDEYTSSDPEGMTRTRKQERRRWLEDETTKKRTTDTSDTTKDRQQTSTFDRQRTSEVDVGRSGPKRPVNGYRDGSPSGSDGEIQARRRQRVNALPDWPDRDEESDAEGYRRARRQPSPYDVRSTDDEDRRPANQSPYGQDVVDTGPGGRDPSRGPYEGDQDDDDHIVPLSKAKVQATPARYPTDDNLRNGIDSRDSTDWRFERNARTDSERFTHVPVTTSSTFDKQDEEYLQRKYTSAMQARSNAVNRKPARHDEAKALLASATQRMNTVETHFGYEGSRTAFVDRLMRGAPKGSVMQWEHTEREEEEIVGPLSESYYSKEYSSADESSMLNFDTVAEKVELSVVRGLAELTVKVRCERIVPVRGGVADLFKKTSIIVTRVIEVDLSVTADRQQLYEHIINQQRQSRTGRLQTEDTFDLYKTFVAMAEVDEAAGRQRPHEVRIDQQVDEQRLIDLQFQATRMPLALNNASATDFRRVDGRLPAVDALDVDFRSRGHQRPIESSTGSSAVMAASRSRQRFYQS